MEEGLTITIPLEDYNQLRDEARNYYYLRDTLIECAYIAQLKPDTEYVVYVYGISLEGERTTDIIATHVKTEPPHEGDITFKLRASLLQLHLLCCNLDAV